MIGLLLKENGQHLKWISDSIVCMVQVALEWPWRNKTESNCSQSSCDGFGSKFLDQGWVNFCCSGWFKSAIQKSPKNHKIFNFFPFGSKKISSGQVKKYPGQRRVSLLFTSGQKYARVRSGPHLYNPVMTFSIKKKPLMNCLLLETDPLWNKEKGRKR